MHASLDTVFRADIQAELRIGAHRKTRNAGFRLAHLRPALVRRLLLRRSDSFLLMTGPLMRVGDAQPLMRFESFVRPLLHGLSRIFLPALIFMFAAGARGQQPKSHHSIDLTPFYTQFFTNLPSGKPWSLVPRGAQTLDGIPFLLAGKVEVTGLDAARHGNFFPPQITGIPVGQKAARLQVLHGAAHGHKDGVPLAKIVLHYANGETQSLRLAYGLHTRNWRREPGEREARPDDPNSRLAWSASGDENEAFEGTLRMYRTPLDQPRPDLIITSLDFVSLFSKATPILFAVTLEQDGPALAPVNEATAGKSFVRSRQWADADYVREITVRATDGGPTAALTNFTASLTVADDESSFFFGEARADGGGRATLSYPPPQTVALGVQVRAPGFVPATVALSAVAGIPAEVRVQMEHGVRIGGVVLDDTRRPIPGTTVFLYRLHQTGAAEFTQTAYDAATTDAAGRWSSASIPREFGDFRLELAHPDFKPATYLVSPTNAAQPRQVASSDLLAGQAVLSQQPQIHVSGDIVDAKGRAITNAEAFLRLSSPGRRDGDLLRDRLRCDRLGHFNLSVPERGDGLIGFSAPGFAPEYRMMNVGPGLAPLKVTLGKGQPLKVRVTDQAGAPVVEASVSLNSWNGVRLLNWSSKTDASGRFVWTNAPLGGVQISVSKDGYHSFSPSIGIPAEGEVGVTLRKVTRVSGAVSDAESRELLDRVDITPAWRATDTDPWRWQRGYSTKAKRGHFTMSLSDLNKGDIKLLVESPGYMPVVLGPFPKGGLLTNDLALKKARGLSGEVILPNGTPANRAFLALLGPDEETQLESGYQFRRASYTGAYVNSDRDGKFEFAPRLESITLLAAHQLGFAETTAAEVAATGKILLKPWGRIEGNVRFTQKPTNGWWVALHSPPHRPGEKDRNTPALAVFQRTRPDTKGRFYFDRVPPGDWRVSLVQRVNDYNTESLPFSHGQPVLVQSSQTNRVDFDDAGRTVSGRIQVTGADPGDVDWSRDAHYLTLQVSGAPDPAPPNLARAKTDAERVKLLKESTARLHDFWSSPKGRVVSAAQRQYALIFDTNGVFRVDGVPPGSYTLSIAPTDPTQDSQTFIPLGSVQQKVTVTAPKNGEALDLGPIKLALRPVVRIGEPAPAVKLKTFDGQPLALESFRGKYLLVDFWDTSTLGRGYDLESIQAIFNDEELSNRIALLSVNLDRDFKTGEAYVRFSPTPGPQCYAGPRPEAKVPAAFGLEEQASGIVILDPEGRIASRPVRNDYIRTTLRRLINPPKR